MKTLETMIEEMAQFSTKKLRQIAAQDYGVELGEAVQMDKYDLLDVILSIEQRNATR